MSFAIEMFLTVVLVAVLFSLVYLSLCVFSCYVVPRVKALREWRDRQRDFRWREKVLYTEMRSDVNPGVNLVSRRRANVISIDAVAGAVSSVHALEAARRRRRMN